MQKKRKHRLVRLLTVLVTVSVIIACILYALKQNIQWYQTPSEIKAMTKRPQENFHLGGFVKRGSIHFVKKGQQVRFQVTDFKASVPVIFNGVLPGLFREGKGAIMLGHFNAEGVFYASEVLAKHDENYKPIAKEAGS